MFEQFPVRSRCSFQSPSTLKHDGHSIAVRGLEALVEEDLEQKDLAGGGGTCMLICCVRIRWIHISGIPVRRLSSAGLRERRKLTKQPVSMDGWTPNRNRYLQGEIPFHRSLWNPGTSPRQPGHRTLELSRKLTRRRCFRVCWIRFDFVRGIASEVFRNLILE